MFNIIRVKNAEEGGKKAFELIKEGVQNGAEVFGLATGSTPETLYQEMVKSDLDFSNCISVNLDEYVGLSGDNDQSYRYFMNEHLFNKKPFKATYVPNGKAEDLEEECRRYEEIISNHPIDIQILGIGENGHIGFNEPGASFDSLTEKVALTESTIIANSRMFDSIDEVPKFAYSMGIKSIMTAKTIILFAYGEKKADAIYKMMEEAPTEALPASALQNHDNVIVIVDEQAASKLDVTKHQ